MADSTIQPDVVLYQMIKSIKTINVYFDNVLITFQFTIDAMHRVIEVETDALRGMEHIDHVIYGDEYDGTKTPTSIVNHPNRIGEIYEQVEDGAMNSKISF